jgi:hypothetical protein
MNLSLKTEIRNHRQIARSNNLTTKDTLQLMPFILRSS